MKNIPVVPLYLSDECLKKTVTIIIKKTYFIF